MSEIPERIEREMFEIRSRMAPDVRDLRQHVEPGVIARQAGDKVKQRLKAAIKGIFSSARKQAQAAGEAGRKRQPARFTDAVKSDPRPLVLLAVVLAVSLLMARRISSARAD